MATKVKETCIYTDARLDVYEGTNPFKVGTSMCTGCGTRVDSVTGEPIEGLTCPVQTRAQTGINAETSQEALAQIMAANEKKVAEAVAAKEAEMKAQYEVEMATAQNLLNTSRAESEEAMAEQKKAHDKEIAALKAEHEETLNEIAKEHEAALKKATAQQQK